VSRYSATYNYIYSYGKYKNPVSTKNSYYNSRTKRTSKPLYVYYRAPNYYNAVGYYSTVFLVVYYDGYGYNFYYGRYGYYDYSINQIPVYMAPPPSANSTAIAGLVVCCVCVGCIVKAILFCRSQNKPTDVENEEDEDEKVVVNMENIGQPPPPGQYDPSMGQPPMYPHGQPSMYPSQPGGYNPNMQGAYMGQPPAYPM
jgi:hypothetical protein